MRGAIARFLAGGLVLWASLCAPAFGTEAALKIGGSGAALGVTRALGQGFAAQGLGALEPMPRGLGSGGGIKAVLAGALDVALVSRPLTEAEWRQGARETWIGRTPLVFVTSHAEPVPPLTGELIVRMFALEQLLWPDGQPVYVVMRPLHEAAFEAVSQHLPGMRDALRQGWAAPGRPHAYTAQDNLEMATRLPDSLALTSLTQLVMERSALVRLPLNGVAPTLENVRTGAYPLTMELYLVTTSRPSAPAEALLGFVRGPKGRSILARAGILSQAK